MGTWARPPAENSDQISAAAVTAPASSTEAAFGVTASRTGWAVLAVQRPLGSVWLIYRTFWQCSLWAG